MPVPLGLITASMNSSVASHCRPRMIARSANGELKLIPCQPTLASISRGTAPMNATCSNT